MHVPSISPQCIELNTLRVVYPFHLISLCFRGFEMGAVDDAGAVNDRSQGVQE